MHRTGAVVCANLGVPQHQEGDMAKGQMRPQKEKKKPKKNKDKKKGAPAPSPFAPGQGPGKPPSAMKG
jgi:hypothetical protein